MTGEPAPLSFFCKRRALHVRCHQTFDHHQRFIFFKSHFFGKRSLGAIQNTPLEFKTWHSGKLDSFSDFQKCKPEIETQLREVWFIYDDEWEYIARANRDEHEIARYSANSFYSHPIITSLLLDKDSLIQGYRMITDPRAPNDIRIKAHTLAMYFKNLFSQARWHCLDEPQGEREAAIEGLFVKKTCSYSDNDQIYRVYESYRLKPGQELDDNKVDLKQVEGQFESTASLEVFRLDAVKDAPCCAVNAHQ